MLWVPMRLDPAAGLSRDEWTLPARSWGDWRPVSPVERAQADLAMIATRLEAEYPAFNTGWSVNVVPLTEQVVGAVQAGPWRSSGASCFSCC